MFSRVSCYITNSADPSKGASLAVIFIKHGGNHRGYSALNETRQDITTGTQEIRENIDFLMCKRSTFNHCPHCRKTGPQPLPTQVFHRVRSRASSLNFQYFLVIFKSPSSCPCLLPRLPVTPNLSFHLYFNDVFQEKLERVELFKVSPHSAGNSEKSHEYLATTATLLIDIQNQLPSRVTENNVLLVQLRHTGLPQQETVGGSTMLDLDAYLTRGSGKLITICHAESPLRYEIYKSKHGLIRHNNVLCSCPDILTSCICFSFYGRPLLSFGENTITGQVEVYVHDLHCFCKPVIISRSKI